MKTTHNFKVGNRVRIIVGAWKGQVGTIRRLIEENGAISIDIDDDISTAFYANELELITV